MKANTLRNLLLRALLFSLILPLVPGVQASGPFATSYSDASLTGVYGYSLEGYVLVNGNTTKYPLDAVGVLWFDGKGTVMFHDTVNVAGAVSERGTADNPVVGTYTVNPDGTGTMQFVRPGGTQAVRAFVIVDGGKELQFGNADSFSVNRGVAKKQ
jgi:hypothetical protein